MLPNCMERTVDARGLSCPLPLVKARAALAELGPADVLVVLATDPEAPIDLAALAADHGRGFAASGRPVTGGWCYGPGPAARTRRGRTGRYFSDEYAKSQVGRVAVHHALDVLGGELERVVPRVRDAGRLADDHAVDRRPTPCCARGRPGSSPPLVIAVVDPGHVEHAVVDVALRLDRRALERRLQQRLRVREVTEPADVRADVEARGRHVAEARVERVLRDLAEVELEAHLLQLRPARRWPSAAPGRRWWRSSAASPSPCSGPRRRLARPRPWP